ncbi:type III PLP-dependent enzyme [Effusibacillus lacus]|uniref:Diaminopimelate decarboxylase n=1 Tax=Effusibacillus lacus TaxID=1348429 RepID=A0A292YH17_9BACL|nr:type III PLP-dependent enzyme [Effusibacillus lacus]TCS70959.1 diaminopimelate decarboxylase [Effusibacillus lacus]GAX90007.1 diaminopimelate decarboxylase [Effusibacillus lacus]
MNATWNITANRIENLIQSLKTERKKPFCAYIYDLKQLREHVSLLTATLPSQCRLFYAVKANSDATILKALAPIVHGFEVASLGEIEKVRTVDTRIPVIFGGPAKTDDEIQGAIHHGVSLLHAESFHELRRIEYIAGQLDVVVPILLRVNLGGPLSTATLQMAGVPTQFGIEEAQVPEAIALARSLQHVDLQGFHFHAMSNNLDAEGHARFITHCVDKAQTWAGEFDLRISYLNVGGGIGVNYHDLERQFDWPVFTSQLDQLIKDHGQPNATMLFECGRYVTAACGHYAAEVLDIKQNHGKHFAVVRGGTHHFRLPAAWKHSHPFTVVPIDEWRYPFARPELSDSAVTVAGELCTPNDVLARDVVVPRIRSGDIILFRYTGAYGWAISHHDFLSHPHPEQIFLDRDDLAID